MANTALTWGLGVIFFLAAVSLAVPAFRRLKAAIDTKYPVDDDHPVHKHHWIASLGGWAGLSLRALLVAGDVLATIIGGVGWVLLTILASAIYYVGSGYLWGPYRWRRKRLRKKAQPL